MANDSEDSRHKHRSSPGGEESREHSKRHKNRHHRHHHRRHSRHSKKHDEEMKEEIEERNEVANKVEEEEVKEIAPLGLLDKTRADYDMEEGEIIEDDDFCPGNGGIGNKDPVSDVEFGEIGSAGARCEEGNSDSRGISAGESRDNRNLNATENDDCKSDSFSNLIADKTDGKKTQSHIDPDELTPKENDAIVYGDRSSTASARSHRITGSLSKISGKRKGHFDIEGVEGSLDLMDVDEHEIGHQQNLFSCGSRMLSHRKVSRSPSHGRCHAEVHDKNRSKSVERVRERSHAQSVLHEVHSKSGHREDDVLNDNWKTDHDADYERVTFPTADNRCNSKDLIKDKERRSSKQIRYTDREDSHYDRPSWDREREEKICRDRKMEREEERQRRDKNCEREMEHHKEMEKERDWRRDRDHEKKQEIGGERERVQERTRDVTRKREHDRDREGSMDRGRIRERDQERERRSNGCKAAYRDRSMERQREKGRDKDGDRARDRQLDREGDGGRDRHGDRDRDIERSSRHHKYDNRDDGFGDRERLRGSKRRVYDGTEYHRGRCREDASGKDRSYEDDSARRSEDKLNRDDDDDDDQEDYQERVELKLAEQEEEDLNRIKEESRRRREAILQKYKTQQLQQEVEPKLGDARREDKEPLDPPFQPLATEDALPMNLYAEGNGQDAYVADLSFSVRKSPPENDTSAVEKTSGAGGLGEGTPTSERCSDMFCDDIFGDSPAGVRKSQGKGDGLPVESNGLYDNWDDPEGYYSYRFGEVLDGRYEIAAAHGKGVFSTVVRAKDLKAGNGDPEEVAVKIIRNNETMLKAGMEELVILKKLVGADPEDRRHCVRFLSSFKYRNHLCLVFESLHMNLREVLKKFGRNIGLKLTAVRAYAKQLFIALKHLRNCGVLHCDIKPDNMLVNDAKNVLKLCDFGNAMFAGKNELTPYLVSRFYRAPEIILGLPYDHPLDMWSVGCCLYELYTGKVLFPGPTNNDMLRLHLELKGPFPKKMLRKGAFTDQHFDQDLNFLATEDDPVTKKTIKRLLVNIKPKDIATIIKGSSGEDPKMLANFKDLLDKIFILDPDKRLTVSQALSHPFITGK